MAPQLKLVAQPPQSPNDEDLRQRSIALWGDNESHRLKWLDAVLYLRTKSLKGWTIDKIIERTPEHRVL